MKYMTFNSSCSYAGVANMLAVYGVETDDRTIAWEMKLPYLVACENGVYLSGPMLQTADWFNIYLNPIGFRMEERELPAEGVSEYLKQQRTAMLGLPVGENGKHAVVYTEYKDEKFQFLNNKWEHDPAPEHLALTESELLEHIGERVMVATLEQIQPKEADVSVKIRKSADILRQNLADIIAVCSRKETVGVLRKKLNTLFRPLFLDGITMLNLLGEDDLAQRFAAIQRSLLNSLRQDAESTIRLGEALPLEELAAATETYICLIQRAASMT